ncbi:MAG: biotin--[acetyl-CoA-carboxylase] ligase [Bacilli bacterium]
MNVTVLEFPFLTSTSLFLKEHYRSLPSWTFIRTDFQSHGYGQHGHVWESVQGENLLFSLLVKPTKVVNLEVLKQQLIKACVDFFHHIKVFPTFKEPNDFYINDDKLCGLLMETKSEKELFSYIIIGIGLNVNQTLFPNLKATSLKNILKKRWDISALFNQFTEMLKDNLTGLG